MTTLDKIILCIGWITVVRYTIKFLYYMVIEGNNVRKQQVDDYYSEIHDYKN